MASIIDDSLYVTYLVAVIPSKHIKYASDHETITTGTFREQTI